MPVTLSALIADRKTVSVPVGDDTLTVTFKPSFYTPSIEAEMQQAAASEWKSGLLVTLLAGALVEWDLLGPDGQPLPTDEATIASLPVGFLGTVLSAISAELGPGKSSERTSPYG